LGATQAEAEDLFLIGRSLVESGQTALGWAALDAASKLDPKHRETAAQLAVLHGRIEKLGVSVRQADVLTAIPSGQALAALVFGILATRKGEGEAPAFDPIVDRLADRSRAELGAIRSVAQARKLLGRVLLELGRPSLARSWLTHDPGPTSDRETNWLLSRAFLAEGAIDKANALAGDLGDDAPLSLEPSPYAGAKTCSECHSAIFRAQQSSAHAATAAWGAGLNSIPLPKNTVIDPANPEVTHRFEKGPAEIEVKSQVRGKQFSAAVAYAVGSARHGMTMLGRDQAGGFRTLRISYYTGGHYWGLTSGFNPTPAEPDRYLGERLTTDGVRECLNCHMTRFRSDDDRNGPEAADRGIGCERCHGPGANHLKAVDAGFAQLAIARPRLAAPSERLKLCATCHSADGSIPPSDPRFLRFHGTTFPYSRCVTESGGRFDCVACHDPHKNAETQPAYYEARCLACHGERKPSQGKLEALRLEAVDARRCPVNSTGACLSCHMPRVENVMPFTTLTDHHIRIHRPAKTNAVSRVLPVSKSSTIIQTAK
jgi:hypothetical protein